MTQEVPPLLTTGEVARELWVTDETVRRWIRDGTLPALTLPSGHFRIRRADLDAILTTEATKAGAA